MTINAKTGRVNKANCIMPKEETEGRYFKGGDRT